MNKFSRIVVLAALGFFLLPGAVQKASAEDGAGIFKKSECTKCHEVKGQIKGDDADAKDLSKEGGKHDAAFITKLLKQDPSAMTSKGKKHPKKFKGSDADLDVLAKWLETLK